jgi:ankyrin repeat protein
MAFGIDVTNDSNDVQTLELIEAVKSNQLDAIRRLVEAGANVNCRTSRGAPLLWLAPSMECLQLLVQLGADVNARHRMSHTLLDSEATSVPADINRIRFLLENGADPNLRDDRGSCPLIEAAMSKNYEVVDLLLEMGADINAQENNGKTALHYSLFGSPLSAKQLIDRGANLELCEQDGDTPLILAVKVPEMSDIDLVGALLERGANPNATGRPDKIRPVHVAAYLGHTELVRKLVSFGADINAADAEERTPLDFAIQFEQFETAAVISSLGGM